MLTEELTRKIKFVEGLSAAYVPFKTNIANIEYVVFEYANYPGSYKEYVVINYVGGAFSARNCTADSFSAIAEEIVKCLDSGYYDEIDDYHSYLASPERYIKLS